MTTKLVFVHGIDNSPSERAGLKGQLDAYLAKYGLGGRFETHVAQWRSLGDFFADLYDLKAHQIRWDEAVEDVAGQISAVASSSTILFVAHSMGQPILVAALARMVGRYEDTWARAALITLGGPMGNGFARPYFNNMPGVLWSTRLTSLTSFSDIHNPEDPVCGGPAYEAFLAATPMRIDTPGHPTPFAPLKEHSSYFDSQAVYDLVKRVADTLEAP